MNFKDILKESLHIQKRRTIPGRPEDYNPYQYIKEFRTIHLDLGRQMGKTEAMLDLFDIEKDLIIVHDRNAKDCMIHRFINKKEQKFLDRYKPRITPKFYWINKDDIPVKSIGEIHRMIHKAPQYFRGKSDAICDKCNQYLPNYFETIWIDEPLLCQNNLSHRSHWAECMVFLCDRNNFDKQRIIKLGA